MPAPGTPLESMMIIVWQMREDITFYAHQALTQATANAEDGDAVKKAWDAFVDASFPWQAEELNKADAAAMEVLRKVVAEGPLHVIPLMPLVNSKLKRNVHADKRMS